MKVGIVAGALKPCTKGHWELIKRASRENDVVRLFVSQSDRKTKNESVVIKWQDMDEIWKRFLSIHLPSNVSFEPVDNPVRSIYETLGSASDEGSIDSFMIYSDPDDIIERFPPESQAKYFGRLVMDNQVKFIGVERVGEMDVSATRARSMLQYGLKDAFIQLMPEGVDREGIWNFLLLKAFVRDVK